MARLVFVRFLEFSLKLRRNWPIVSCECLSTASLSVRTLLSCLPVSFFVSRFSPEALTPVLPDSGASLAVG